MSHINLDYLRLMTDGDEDMEKTMIGMLLVELPEELAQMQALLNVQDWEELSKVSHKMKSTLTFVGNDAMTTANNDIELFSKKLENLEHIEWLMSVLRANLPLVMEELQRL